MLKILDALANEPSKNAKEDILNEVKNGADNELFKAVVIAAFHPTTEYYIKNFDMPDSYEGTATLESALDALSELSERKVTGNAAREYLHNLLQSLTEDDAEVLKRVVKRDLRCGVQVSTVNKVWEDLIYQHPYMRCSGFSDKTLKGISLPCITQLKADGLYCDVVVRSDSVTYMSRSGKVIEINEPNRDDLLKLQTVKHGEFVIQGEVVVVDDAGNIMERSASNGYINSDDKDTSRIHIMAWDMIPLEDWLIPKREGKKTVKKCETPYDQRLSKLITVLDVITGHGIELIDHRVCNTVEEIVDHFREVREREEEGIILKDSKCIWKDGTSKQMIKLKVIIEVELRITGWYYGSKGTKTEHLVGGVECESECGEIQANFGSLSDKNRTEWLTTLDDMIANRQVVTVKCNGVTTVDTPEGKRYSLFLPRFKEMRMDKSKADTREKIQEQEKSFTDALKLLEA